MATSGPDYGNASGTLTVTGLNSLATAAGLDVGVEIGPIDNSSNEDDDIIVSGSIFVGTTPTINTVIEVWAIPEQDDSTWPDVLDGTASAETINHRDMLPSMGKRLATLRVSETTSDQGYPFWASLKQKFGTVPRKCVLFVTHNTGVNLKSSSHVINTKRVPRVIA